MVCTIRCCAGLLVLPLVFLSAAAAQDVNSDGLFDCVDADLIGTAVPNQSMDLSFDFDEDGVVTANDLFWAIRRAGFEMGDANLDGEVDRLDMNTFGLNWQRSVTSYCQGDFDFSGFVDSSDNGYLGINWQRGPLGIEGNMPAADVTLVTLPSRLDAWQGNGFVFAETGPFELVAIPQRAPEGLLATAVAIRTKDPTHRIVTFDTLEVTGAVHQVFEPVPFGGGWPTPFGIMFDFRPLGLKGVGRWNQADTHLLIRAEMIGAGGGGAFAGTTEDNDLTDPVQLQPVLEPFSSLAGLGTLQSGFPTDAFFLWEPFQTDYAEFAQLVTPADTSGEMEGVFLRVGIQGGDADRNPLPFHGVIGLEDPLPIPFFAQPCDFNSDGFCDQTDLDRLDAAVAEGSSDPDLNLDGSDPPLVTQIDIDAWHNLSDPIPGDTDYDGDVDATDLNNLARNWQINANAPRFGGLWTTSWEGGDLNYDGHVDALDLNLLGIHWQRGTEPTNAPVPEPPSAALLVIALAALCLETRKA